MPFLSHGSNDMGQHMRFGYLSRMHESLNYAQAGASDYRSSLSSSLLPYFMHMRSVKALARLCVGTGSPEHSPLADVVSTKISCAVPIILKMHHTRIVPESRRLLL